MLYEKQAETIPMIPLVTPKAPLIMGNGVGIRATAPSAVEIKFR